MGGVQGFCLKKSELAFSMFFIEDLFIICKGTEDGLHAYMEQLNRNDKNIKLTYTYSQDTVN